MDRTYRIFTDGSAIGNPGPGGWGVVVIQGKECWEMSGAHSWTTISEMELVARFRRFGRWKAERGSSCTQIPNT